MFTCVYTTVHCVQQYRCKHSARARLVVFYGIIE